MGHKSRWECFRAIYGRYQKGDRKARQAILNEFCLNTGYHRKYAIRLLNGASPGPRASPSGVRRKRALSCGPKTLAVLIAVWEAAGYPWSVRLKAILPTWKPVVGRGSAVADFDNDGDLDVAISVSGSYPQLLRNDGGNANNWLEVMLIGTKSNRDGVGAALKLVSEGFTQHQQRKGGMSYMSAHDPRVHFGLGQRKSIERLEITWPSGAVDELTNIPINQIITVKEGRGIIPRSFPRIPSK